MTAPCAICLRDAERPAHVACSRELFGTTDLPTVDVELARLQTVGLAMVGRTSLPGVQRKVSLGLDAERATLQVGVGAQRYILKPEAARFEGLPANEHVTMRIAAASGIEIPPCGLVPLRDGSSAFITGRFDRPVAGGKLAMEDFCQLSERAQKEKYVASIEDAVEIVRRFAGEPLIELRKLFRMVAFAWWTGNGDLHLKNLALLSRAGLYELSPAYDLLCTRLIIPGDRMALPLREQTDAYSPGVFRYLAERCGLPWKAAERVLRELVSVLPTALDLVQRSALPDAQKGDYADLLRERSTTLLI